VKNVKNVKNIKNITKMLPAATAALATLAASGPPPTHRNFVSCPIVQDTKTVPCWMSDYEGERYYLGIQTDVTAEFHPPYLGHKVLVEGTVSDEPRICGGIVLKPVKVSPLPELDGTCNAILPAVDQYSVPFAPRPPGPSGGRLAFEAPPQAPAAPLKPPFPAKTFTLAYDFDMLVMGRHAAVLSQVTDYANLVGAKRLRISALSGATLLSDGRVMAETPDIARARAAELVDLLKRAGLTRPVIETSVQRAPAPNGVEDWRTRSATIVVEP
jgi:hypothetical protein